MIHCPSCGAALPVRELAVPYTTCTHCQSLILRKGQALEEIGKVAEVPFDISPIRLGTRFTVDGTEYTAAGRVRWGWSGGSWNEWLLATPGGEGRWLGEAMGLYMLTAERAEAMADPLARAFAEGRDPLVGQGLNLDGIAFEVSDIKQAECLGSEGDLPFPTLPGWSMTNVDFRAPGGEALSLQRDANGTSAWLGTWHELSGLSPRALREIDGWPLPAALQ